MLAEMSTSHIVNANATKKERVCWKVRRRVQTKGLEGGLMGGVEGGLMGGVEGGLMGGVEGGLEGGVKGGLRDDLRII